MMLDATQFFAHPLTADRLFGWHAALFPTRSSGMSRVTIGAWHTSVGDSTQVVSGPVGREHVHYEAPEVARLDAEMAHFLHWFETVKVDPVLRAGVAHFWFVTVHPFDDGNGRIVRTIADLALARAEGTPSDSTACPPTSAPSGKPITTCRRPTRRATLTSLPGCCGSSPS